MRNARRSQHYRKQKRYELDSTLPVASRNPIIVPTTTGDGIGDLSAKYAKTTQDDQDQDPRPKTRDTQTAIPPERAGRAVWFFRQCGYDVVMVMFSPALIAVAFHPIRFLPSHSARIKET